MLQFSLVEKRQKELFTGRININISVPKKQWVKIIWLVQKNKNLHF